MRSVYNGKFDKEKGQVFTGPCKRCGMSVATFTLPHGTFENKNKPLNFDACDHCRLDVVN